MAERVFSQTKFQPPLMGKLLLTEKFAAANLLYLLIWSLRGSLPRILLFFCPLFIPHPLQNSALIYESFFTYDQEIINYTS